MVQRARDVAEAYVKSLGMEHSIDFSVVAAKEEYRYPDQQVCWFILAEHKILKELPNNAPLGFPLDIYQKQGIGAIDLDLYRFMVTWDKEGVEITGTDSKCVAKIPWALWRTIYQKQ